MDRFVRLVLLWLTCLGLTLGSVGLSKDSSEFDEASLEFFEKQVRPILAAKCFECHSTGKGSLKGGLALDSREALLKGGDTGPGVMLDKPSESLFVSAINYGDVYQMPPKSKLPANEIAVLTRWVEMGLPWPKEAVSKAGTVKPFDLASRTSEHWCWQPVKNIALPDVHQKDWPITDTDRFILAKLESRGLKPTNPADKRTLLRRVYFDLIGLPPSPEEVEQFVQDQRPQALEVVVDRLLGSVHFGERWGRHWLDLTRYAETRGHEFEPVIPNAWQFRDYVIRALNADVPFDRFLTEQIAGDLIEPRWRKTENTQTPPPLPINESLIGTGFWFLGEEVHSPVDIRKDETDRMDNRLDVMSKTFLGLTVACARCHDHKFDAISQKDYYALAGFAISGSYRQVRVDTAEQHHQIALQLDELRSNARRETGRKLVDSARPVLEKLDRYWLAAKQALDEGVSIAAPAGENQSQVSGYAIVQRLATDNQLDFTLLTRWCIELNTAKKEPQHPLHRLFAGDSNIPASVPGQPAGTAPGEEATRSIPGLVVDFGDHATDMTMQDGVSFGLRPVPRGQLILGTEKSNASVATVGGWERDLFWKNIKIAPGTEVDNGTLGAWQQYGRMVRTPEFTLSKRNVWYLIRGSVRAYASVNSHLIVVGPLHGSVLREFKHADDQWHWVSHDLSQYAGHRMHVEFSPADDGPCSIAMVVQSDIAPPPIDQIFSSSNDFGNGAKPGAERIASYQAAIRTAANSILEGNPDKQVADTIQIQSASKKGAWAQLANWIVTHQSLFSLDEFKSSTAGLADEETALAKQVQWESRLAPAMLDGNGVDEFLLVRGNSNTPKELVSRRFLEAFHGREQTTVADNVDTKTSTSSGSGRRELALEMLRSPLVSRVAVNRIWHHLFGRGIVPTVDNMGVLGLPPSNPELLDHLAARFVNEGWSTKGMIRSLVLSRTYQMSSHPTVADAVDPDNELWHRMPIKRLEGEVIRDSLLAVSGRLDPTPFGPSVPIHLTEFMQGRGRPGNSGPLDGAGRRSIYISVRRNFLSPMMLAFDTPSPFSTVGRRTVSNVPAQALILMNDPFVVEQANRWSERLLADASQNTQQRLDQLYLTAFARKPNASESAEAIAFLNFQGADKPENQRVAWNNLCHVMFNLKEFVFVE
ncbi:MAG: PSD1 and planctomycete cytochrome C domain-containing protein [Schlesneria sp.]